MQTFLPYPNFAQSARVLDRLRLGKQRVEALQILNALERGGAWANHPAVRMWRGYDGALCLYGLAMCDEWIARGYRDSLRARFVEALDNPTTPSWTGPSWLGREDFHRSHRANLVRKDPAHYAPIFGPLPPEPYAWPA